MSDRLLMENRARLIRIIDHHPHNRAVRGIEDGQSYYVNLSAV
jgi:hypothetical protein